MKRRFHEPSIYHAISTGQEMNKKTRNLIIGTSILIIGIVFTVPVLAELTDEPYHMPQLYYYDEESGEYIPWFDPDNPDTVPPSEGCPWWDRDGNGEFDVPINRRLDLTARWLTIPSTLLYVVDFESNKNLDSVELITGVDHILWSHPYGKRTQVLHKSTSSPIELNDTISMREYIEYSKKEYLARAPGYAWNRIEIDFKSGESHQLKLKRAGSIEINIKDYKKLILKNLIIDNINY